MIKVLINGINGKMGQEVENAIRNSNEFEVICGLDLENNIKHEFPVYKNTLEIEKKPDVIIDFSVPKATLNIAEYALENNIPIVIATTRIIK